MDTNSTAAIGLHASSRAAKTITLISVVTCLAVTDFAAAVHGFTEAPATQPRSPPPGVTMRCQPPAQLRLPIMGRFPPVQHGRPRANARTGRG